VLAGLSTFVLVGGVALGALTAFWLLRAPADTIIALAPASSALYASAEVQPTGDQALALSSLASRFPILSDSGKRAHWVDQMIDAMLQGSGLSSADVLPWLGPEVGTSVDAQALRTPGASPDYAFYVTTTDDAATQAALRTWEQHGAPSPDGSAPTFTTSTYAGVTITAMSVAGQPSASFAIVDHVLAFAGSSTYLDRIVDTAQGRAPGLRSAPDYQRVQEQLPSERLGLVFLDYPALMGMLQNLPSTGPSLQPELQALRAYRGVGISVAAQSGGIAIDTVLDYDPAQMGADLRAVLGATPDANTAAGLTPASAVAFYGFTGTRSVVRMLVDDLDAMPSQVSGFLSQSGLGTMLSSLSGDLGIELDDRGGTPAGALVVGTSDAAATRQLLDSAIPSLVGESAVAGAAPAPPSLSHTTYRGVDISVCTLPAARVSLAWTVSGGELILASSAAEVEAIVDTGDGAPSLAGSPGYAQSAGSQPSVAVGYVDMSQLSTLIDHSLDAAARATFESQVLPNLRPIRSISMTAAAGTDESSDHILIAIP
jgi:hypothetical protein